MVGPGTGHPLLGPTGNAAGAVEAAVLAQAGAAFEQTLEALVLCQGASDAKGVLLQQLRAERAELRQRLAALRAGSGPGQELPGLLKEELQRLQEERLAAEEARLQAEAERVELGLERQRLEGERTRWKGVQTPSLGPPSIAGTDEEIGGSTGSTSGPRGSNASGPIEDVVLDYRNLDRRKVEHDDERRKLQVWEDQLETERRRLFDERGRLDLDLLQIREERRDLVQERWEIEEMRRANSEGHARLLEELSRINARQKALEQERVRVLEERQRTQEQREALEQERKDMRAEHDKLLQERERWERERLLLQEESARCEKERRKVMEEKASLLRERGQLERAMQLAEGARQLHEAQRTSPGTGLCVAPGRTFTADSTSGASDQRSQATPCQTPLRRSETPPSSMCPTPPACSTPPATPAAGTATPRSGRATPTEQGRDSWAGDSTSTSKSAVQVLGTHGEAAALAFAGGQHRSCARRTTVGFKNPQPPTFSALAEMQNADTVSQRSGMTGRSSETPPNTPPHTPLLGRPGECSSSQAKSSDSAESGELAASEGRPPLPPQRPPPRVPQIMISQAVRPSPGLAVQPAPSPGAASGSPVAALTSGGGAAGGSPMAAMTLGGGSCPSSYPWQVQTRGPDECGMPPWMAAAIGPGAMSPRLYPAVGACASPGSQSPASGRGHPLQPQRNAMPASFLANLGTWGQRPPQR